MLVVALRPGAAIASTSDDAASSTSVSLTARHLPGDVQPCRPQLLATTDRLRNAAIEAISQEVYGAHVPRRSFIEQRLSDRSNPPTWPS